MTPKKRWKMTPQEELLDALTDMVGQHCFCRDAKEGEPPLDSMCLSSNAYAMRVLSQHGIIKITSEYGRRVIADWVKKS